MSLKYSKFCFIKKTIILFFFGLSLSSKAETTIHSQKKSLTPTKNSIDVKSSKEIRTPAKSKTEDKKILKLSQKKILTEALSSSPYIQKIKATNEKQKSQILDQLYSFSDWGLFANWNQSKRKNPQVTAFETKEKETESWSLGLKKKLLYGLDISSAYNYLNESQTNSDFLKNIQPNNIYRKNLSLELNASLTSALSQYWTVESLQKMQTANDWLYYEQAEELALKAVGQYWKTYLAHISYLQTQKGLKTYKKLVRQINSKKKYNFLNPGERPQVLAEYENIKQFIDQQKQNYEKEKKALLLFLKKDPDKYEIVFQAEKPEPIPSFPELKIEDTRLIKIKDNQIAQQKLKLMTKKTFLFPNFQLSGKGGMIPAGTSSDLEFSSKQSFYEIGLSLSWPLFSKSFYEKVNQEQYQLEENKIDFEITKQELKNKLSQLEKELAISYTNIKRSEKATRYQKQAFRELQRSFEQGRVDIFELINIENKLRESEIKKKKALSEYSLLTLQMLALRDQLVESYLKL
ncbi:MAG: TolC family protein [Bdellovibrionaceae bacterium]|nr:TolC family protein [Pseudobdellovibrionaceae bacterium]